MNILQRTVLEVKIGEKYFKFECLPDSSLADINQALVTMNNYVLSRIEEAKKQSEQQLQEKEAETSSKIESIAEG